jgi:hypothetical protein
VTDVLTERLSSSHLEDLAFIVLSSRPDTSHLDLYPELGSDARARLRSRLRQLSRYDFPASLAQDKALRRGYTLRQCCKLTIALLLVDAHLPASVAVAVATSNDLGFLRAMANRLARDGTAAAPDDLVAVVIAGELQDALGAVPWLVLEPARVRFVQRTEVGQLWSADLTGSGARLVVDVATAAGALWQWISGRRLMTDRARVALLAEIERDDGPGFADRESVPTRR